MKAKVISSEEGKTRTGDIKKNNRTDYLGIKASIHALGHKFKNVLDSVLPEARIAKEYLWDLIPGLTPK